MLKFGIFLLQEVILIVERDNEGIVLKNQWFQGTSRAHSGLTLTRKYNWESQQQPGQLSFSSVFHGGPQWPYSSETLELSNFLWSPCRCSWLSDTTFYWSLLHFFDHFCISIETHSCFVWPLNVGLPSFLFCDSFHPLWEFKLCPENSPASI